MTELARRCEDAEGRITASCGCKVATTDDLIDVEFDGETCVAGEGFVPCTTYASFCQTCAAALRAGGENG